MLPRQVVASFLIAVFLLVLIIRLVQKGRLDIAYCWLWLGIGLGIVLVVVRYEWLVRFARLIGAITTTTALFLLGFLVLLLMCLQFSLVISAHRRQIKRLTQRLALVEKEAAGASAAQTPAGAEEPGGKPS